MPRRARTAIAIGVFVALSASPTAATRAPGAAYDLSIAGLPIGEATLDVSIAGGRYAVDATADFGFLFWGGRGGARSEGLVADGRLRPQRYRLAYEGVRRPGLAEIDFEDGRAVRWANEPQPEGDWAEGRTAVEPGHLSDVIDPLAALVAPLPADAPPAAVCARLAPVFSGLTRFDLELTGALGPADPAATEGAVTCETRYRPVAGHRPDSPGVARLQRPGAVSLTLAPIAEGAWAPLRLALETRFGPFVMTRRPPGVPAPERAAQAAPAPARP
jgi:hypothetical protein